MVEKEFLCMKEAAQMLGINERTMKGIIENNNIQIDNSFIKKDTKKHTKRR